MNSEDIINRLKEHGVIAKGSLEVGDFRIVTHAGDVIINEEMI